MNQTGVNEPGANETGANESAMNEAAMNETATNETATNETATNETATNETATNGAGMNDTGVGPHPRLDFRPAAVLFDMDGLLLDSESALLDCWREAARMQGVRVDDALWLSMIGLSDAVCDELLVRSVGEHAARALRGRCRALYEARVERGIAVKPGAFELLALLQAHAVPRAVVTSTWRERARRKLAAAGLLPHFGEVIGGGDVARPKPAPDAYLLAAQRLQVAPHRCVVLEDSGAGVRAALAAGMHPIQVPDLAHPDADLRALGHRILATLRQAHALIEAAL